MKPTKNNKYHKTQTVSKYKIADFFSSFAFYISGMFMLIIATMIFGDTLIDGWIVIAIFVTVGLVFSPYFYKKEKNSREIVKKKSFSDWYDHFGQTFTMVFLQAFCGCGSWVIFLLLLFNLHFSIPDTGYQAKLPILDRGVDKGELASVYVFVRIGERLKKLRFNIDEEQYLNDYQYVYVEIQEGRLGFQVVKKQQLLRN